MKPWAVALLAFLLGAGVTALILVIWMPPAWRIVAGAAGLLVASKLAAVSAAAWRERGDSEPLSRGSSRRRRRRATRRDAAGSRP